MTTLLAWRNLVQDPIRFIATLIGIVFSVVLMAVQTGMLIGFSETASGLVRHAGADIWIASRGTTNVDQSAILNERSLYKVLKNDGIAVASRFIVRFTTWQKPDGGSELVILVGFDPHTRMGAPWNVAEGSVDMLDAPNAVMIDRLYAKKLGVTAAGQDVEIAGRRARVAGFTDGVRTFTQSPYVFTSYNNALRYTEVLDGNASYFLIKAKEGRSIPGLVEALKAAVPDAVMTGDAFARKTENYWIFTTGAGSALVLGSILGAIVGLVIVAQTLYAATMERIGEYATLSAIGAGSGYLNAIVIKQAIISGAIGFAIGATIALTLAAISKGGPAAIFLPPWAVGLLALICLAMCVSSSVLAIRKLMTIDPTSVFR